MKLLSILYFIAIFNCTAASAQQVFDLAALKPKTSSYINSKSFSLRMNLQRVFQNLSFTQPIHLTSALDGTNRIFVVERAGRIKVFANDYSSTSLGIFLDIRSRVNSSPAEGGLLSVAFHPSYETNGKFYVNYTSGNLFTHVSEFNISNDPNVADESSERILLRIKQPFGNHNGGQIAFGPDGYFYIGMGDGGSGGDPYGNGQDRTTLLGSILRIDIDHKDAGKEYAIPADNPFVGNTNNWREEIWAYGLRNPWRFSFDRLGGTLWVGDVGQNRWEEVDIIKKGNNYGWNIMEGFHCYPPGTLCDTTNLSLPIVEYSRSAARSITGGFVYRGARLSNFYGVYLVADYVSGNVWGLRFENNELKEHFQLLDTNLQFTSFGEDEDGEVYFVAYDGSIYIFEGESSIVEIPQKLPQRFLLRQNYPNPFNPITTIPYQLRQEGFVELSIYNILGHRIKSLVKQYKPQGSYEATWDGKDEKDNEVVSGIYLMLMKARTGNFKQVRKVLLSR